MGGNFCGKRSRLLKKSRKINCRHFLLIYLFIANLSFLTRLHYVIDYPLLFNFVSVSLRSFKLSTHNFFTIFYYEDQDIENLLGWHRRSILRTCTPKWIFAISNNVVYKNCINIWVDFLKTAILKNTLMDFFLIRRSCAL
jgi:hypothetical protein